MIDYIVNELVDGIFNAVLFMVSLVIIIIGLIIYTYILLDSRAEIMQDAIDRGYAEHNEQTKEWQWKSEPQ